jgi:hypothetical protein
MTNLRLEEEEMPDVPFEETPKSEDSFVSERFSA